MSHATRCTILEVHALNYWRSRGVMIKAGEPIPLVEDIKPFEKRRPVLYLMACTGICLIAVGLGCTWLAYGAGLMK